MYLDNVYLSRYLYLPVIDLVRRHMSTDDDCVLLSKDQGNNAEVLIALGTNMFAIFFETSLLFNTRDHFLERRRMVRRRRRAFAGCHKRCAFGMSEPATAPHTERRRLNNQWPAFPSLGLH